MKFTLGALFLLNINPAWAHTGHTNNAYIFAFSVMAIVLLAKPVFGKLIKIKKHN